MQSFKSFTALGTADEYKRMNREAIIYYLINTYEQDSVIPDNDVNNPDVQAAVANNTYKKPKLTIAQKRRLRNELFRNAQNIVKKEGSGSVYDYDVLARAYFSTGQGSKYSRYAQYRIDNPDSIMKNILPWNNGAACLVSPYDPFFSNGDSFDDKHDHIGYMAYSADDIANGDPMISSVYLSYNDLREGNADKAREVEGPRVKSGFAGIERYIKDKNNKAAVRDFLMSDSHRDLEENEKSFMADMCKYLSNNGIEFDIRYDRPDKISARIPSRNNMEIRLLDLKEPIYQGRLYINGKPIYAAPVKTPGRKNKDENSKLAHKIPNRVKMMPAMYFLGTSPLAVREYNMDGSDITFVDRNTRGNRNINTAKHINNLVVGRKQSLQIYVPGASNSNAPYNSVARGTSKSSKSSVLLAYMNTDGSRPAAGNDVTSDTPNVITMMVQSTASVNYDSPETRFRKSIVDLRNDYLANPTEGGIWDTYRNTISIEDAVPEDIETYTDANGDEFQYVKMQVNPDNYDYYRHLPVRNTLNEWVESAKDNHRKLMDFDGLRDDYETYLIDPTHEFSSLSDDSLNELRTIYQKVLTGKLKDLKNVRIGNLDADYVKEFSESFPADGTVDEKFAFIEEHYKSYLESEFGSVPYLQKPGQPPVDNTGRGFNPEMVAQYTTAAQSAGMQKNYDYIRHMLKRLEGDYNPDWISGDNYISDQIKNDLISFDDNNIVASFNYSELVDQYGIVTDDKINALLEKSHAAGLSSKPVTYDMMRYAAKTLVETGCDPSRINIAVDANGIIRYAGVQPTRKYERSSTDITNEKNRIANAITVSTDSLTPSDTDGFAYDAVVSYDGKRYTVHLNAESKEFGSYKAQAAEDIYAQMHKSDEYAIGGYIGQIFEPDEYGAIDPQYVVDTDNILIPGYNAYLVDNDPENPVPARDRLRLTGWEKQMKQAINFQIKNAAYTLREEYDFIPHTTALNSVYRHAYTTAVPREQYRDWLPKDKDHPTAEERSFVNRIRTLRGRCRYPNAYDEGATTDAQSMLEHPYRDESKQYDFTYSDLNDNHNFRVLDETMDGIFDPEATGTARTQGIVRYLAEGVTVDNETGKVTAVEFGSDDPIPSCPAMKDYIFRYKDFNSWDRLLMSFSQYMSAPHIAAHTGIAMMNCKGWTFDDGVPVRKSWAEKYNIIGSDGKLRALGRQDKVSDMGGNKGVINVVIDPDLASDEIAATLTDAIEDIESPDINNASITYLDGNEYYVEFDPDSEDTHAMQAAKQIQKALGIDELDDLMRLFRDNPKLDMIMSPYSGMSRSNGGTIVSLMEEPENMVVDGKIIEGGMGYGDIIVVDMPADVKSHYYDEEAVSNGKGRKASGQLAWVLQCKMAYALCDEFFGSNSKAFDDLREYAIAIGFDVDEKMSPTVGYSEQTSRGEKRRLIKLPDVNDISIVPIMNNGEAKKYKLETPNNSNGGKDVYGDISNRVLEQLNESGGFMELPFPLKFNTLSEARNVIGRNLISDDMLTIKKTGQTYTDVNGVEHETYGMPVLSQSLRSGQDLQDGTSRVHDYTNAYVQIYRLAALYMGYEAEKNDINELIKSTTDEKELKKLKSRLAVLEGVPEHNGELARKGLLETCIADAQAKFDEVTLDIARTRFNDKYNVIREEIMSNRLSNSATAVWSADPRLKSDEVAMSFTNAAKLGLTNTFVRDTDALLADKTFDKSFNNTYCEITDESGNKIYERVTSGDDINRLIGEGKNVSSVHQLPKDASVLVWRDPILHDGCVRYMRVKIDDSLIGCAINPVMDASFEGDFDGDSVALVKLQSKASQAKAYTAFSFETNLLNKKVKIEKTSKDAIRNPDTGEAIDGYPLFIQSGMDLSSVMYDKPELRKKIDSITYNVNVMEAKAVEWEKGKISDDEISVTVRMRDKTVKNLHAENAYKTVTKTGKAAINHLRKAYKNEIDKWLAEALDGIGNDHIVVKDEKTVVKSFQHIVDNKSKGSQSKMLELANNMGVEYELDADGHADASTARKLYDENGNHVSRYVLDGTKREINKKIQETTAYKSDNTALGGKTAQRAVAAFRDVNIEAALNLTAPVTQAILQSKHDPLDAKVKDEITRFWGSDVWNGYKLTGNWSDGVSVDDLQKQSHEKISRPVINPETGEPIRNKSTGEIETEYVKCTREEWIAQMKGMFSALKVDINPDYIKELADVMSGHEPGVAVSAETGYDITYKSSSGQIMPVRSGDSNTVIGLDAFTERYGTLVDKMIYSNNKLGAFINAALQNDDRFLHTASENAITAYKVEDRNKNCTATSFMGSVWSGITDINNANNKLIAAKEAYVDAEDKDEAKLAVRNAETELRAVNERRSNSSMFTPRLYVNELCNDINRKEAGTENNIIHAVKKGQIVVTEKAPVPVGRKDCRMTKADYENGCAYMGESQKHYEARLNARVVQLETEDGHVVAQVLAQEHQESVAVNEQPEVQTEATVNDVNDTNSKPVLSTPFGNVVAQVRQNDNAQVNADNPFDADTGTRRTLPRKSATQQISRADYADAVLGLDTGESVPASDVPPYRA